MAMRNWLGIAALFIGFITAISCLAADEHRPEGRGFFILGKHFQTPASLNGATGPRGYGTFKDALLIGGQGYGAKGRLLLGGEGYAILFSDPAGQTQSGYNVSLSGGVGFFDIGYLLNDDPDWHVYSMLGIGGGGLGLHVHDINGGSFGSLLDNPRRGTDLSRGFLALNFSLGTDCLFAMDRKLEGREGGLAVGARVGYLLSLAKFRWNSHEAQVTDGPDTGIDGFYLALMIGGGGRDRKE